MTATASIWRWLLYIYGIRPPALRPKTSTISDGGEASAADDGSTDPSEWQRSASREPYLYGQALPGIIIGYRQTPSQRIKRKNLHISVEVDVRITYLPGQSPAKYCRRK